MTYRVLGSRLQIIHGSTFEQAHSIDLDEGELVCMLTYAHVCSRMLTYAHVCSRMLTHAHVCSRMPTHAHVCSRMLTYRCAPSAAASPTSRSRSCSSPQPPHRPASVRQSPPAARTASRGIRGNTRTRGWSSSGTSKASKLST
jgi:hypothetical protein